MTRAAVTYPHSHRKKDEIYLPSDMTVTFRSHRCYVLELRLGLRLGSGCVL